MKNILLKEVLETFKDDMFFVYQYENYGHNLISITDRSTHAVININCSNDIELINSYQDTKREKISYDKCIDNKYMTLFEKLDRILDRKTKIINLLKNRQFPC